MRTRSLLPLILAIGVGLAMLRCGSASAPTPQIPIADHACGPEGSAVSTGVRALNRLKNRDTGPGAGDLDPGASMAALLAPGDDRGRWSTDRGAQVEGWVLAVYSAGKGETANCGATDEAHMDVHMELGDSLSVAPKERVVAEITPRARQAAAARGEDWSAAALKARLLRQRVRVKGWMLFDFEHEGESEHTAPGHAGNWRATAWELHPVSEITVL